MTGNIFEVSDVVQKFDDKLYIFLKIRFYTVRNRLGLNAYLRHIFKIV